MSFNNRSIKGPQTYDKSDSYKEEATKSFGTGGFNYDDPNHRSLLSKGIVNKDFSLKEKEIKELKIHFKIRKHVREIPRIELSYYGQKYIEPLTQSTALRCKAMTKKHLQEMEKMWDWADNFQDFVYKTRDFLNLKNRDRDGIIEFFDADEMGDEFIKM